jgi:trimethylamine--corrinoid protein Co-methyltransferase
VGTSAAKEVSYLAELARLVTSNDEYLLRTQPPIFVSAYCTTSPLKIDTRSCEVLEEALKYKFPVNFCPMPILGGTAPVTPAASAIIAAAEILGGITATSLIDPELYYYGTAITAEMDMITTNVCYATPSSILTDVLLHQLFRYKYGIVLNVEPAYIEAKTPGIQASLMKLFRQMAFASTVSSSLPIGLLDNASTFSPTQAIIDYDINNALHQFSKGVEINSETMCLDLIKDLEFCEKGNYLESEHTLNNFRDILWDSIIFDRTYRKDDSCKIPDMDERLLRKADQIWRDLVSSQKDIEVEPTFKREVDRIVKAAQKELLQ